MTPTDSSTGTATDSSNGTVPTLTLNDDNVIPVIGLGVAELSEDETERAVSAALEAGYRLIDTASVYGNEAAVGRAIAASGVPRAELFISTKLANRDQGYSTTRESLQTSLEKLGLDYVDMFMIHWPAAHLGLYVDSYGMMQVLAGQGLLRSIGVCNFLEEHLTPISELTYTNPAVNQIELHPLLNQAAMRQNHANREMVTQAYSPLGVGAVLDNPTLIAIGEKYGKSPAQVAIRWSIQLGNVVIPRSGNPARIAENIDVFGFELSDEDMAAINGLDNGTRFRPDPATYTGD